MSLIFPTIYALVKYELDNIVLKNYEIKKIRNELVRCLKGRFKHVFEDDIYIASTVLNWKYKNLKFIKDDAERIMYLNRAKKYLTNFNNKCENTSLSRSPEPSFTSLNTQPQSSSSSSSSMSENSILSSSDNTPVSVNQSRKTSRRLTINRKNNFLEMLSDPIDSAQSVDQLQFADELNEYLNCTKTISSNCQLNENSLKFFDEFKSLFPRVAKIAKILLCIPASSVPAESLFSVTGIIQNEQRNRINPLLLNYVSLIKLNE